MKEKVRGKRGQPLSWTPERVKALNDLRRAGIPDSKLATAIGVSRQRIHGVGGPITEL